MTKRKIKYLHIFIWFFAIFANIPYSGINNGMPPRQIVSYIIGFLYLMVTFYLFYLFIAPLFLNRKKLAGFFIISFLVVLIMPFFGYIILYLTRAYFDGTFEHFFRGYSIKTHMSGYFPVLTAAVFGSFFRVIINWFNTMNQKTEIERQKLSVELDLLKSKLNPHFLFNTLNNIDSLIHLDPEKASASLIRLSEMMRYLTYETKSAFVQLEKEVEYIQNLIELYRMRIKSPDDLRFNYSGDMKTLISPALFIPLLENALKFGRFRNLNPSLDIYLRSEKGIIVFEISNFFDKDNGMNSDKNSGLGIANLRRRLELVYPEKHQMVISDDNQQYRVKLRIDANGDQVRNN
jgi:two-component system, LytTR family, sensor kinase